jgi:hypothetical protein
VVGKQCYGSACFWGFERDPTRNLNADPDLVITIKRITVHMLILKT